MHDPHWVYHPHLEAKIVSKHEFDKLLDEGWFKHPAEFPFNKADIADLSGVAGNEINEINENLENNNEDDEILFNLLKEKEQREIIDEKERLKKCEVNSSLDDNFAGGYVSSTRKSKVKKII